MSAKKYFGTDGIRGRVGDDLINPEFILKLGWAIGKVISVGNPSPRVLIGKDTRLSGYMLESALEAGLSAAGVISQLLGPMPTPAIAYLTRTLRASAGIVISASHNPYQDNGIKIFSNRGMKLSDELEQAIEARVGQPLKCVPSSKMGRAVRIDDAPARYIEFCKGTFPTQLSLNGLKVVLDCANGATYHVAPCVMEELGAKVFAINVDPDGTNINKRCGAIDTRILKRAVIRYKADVGLAFDGDGDRLIMVDNKGEIVDGDEILCILAKDWMEQTASTFGVVGTVMSNLGLEQALDHMGIGFKRAKVGDRYVLEELLKLGWPLGGESSGHIVNLNHTTTGDGIITGLQILRIMQTTNQTLAQLKSIMIKHPQVLINVPVSGIFDLDSYPKIQSAIQMAEKKLKGKGRLLIRPSGTEPLIRVMVEGENQRLVNNIAHDLAEIIQQEISNRKSVRSK